MRKTLAASASSALAAAALVLGAGTAAAQDVDQPDAPDNPACIVIETYTGAMRTMCLTPQMLDSLGSIGYGSAGTGSLMDVLTGVINFGSTTLSVDVPNSTGSYAPGSFGSYGPEASVGQLLTGSLGTFAGST